MKLLLKLFKSGSFWLIQIVIIMLLTVVTQRVLETIPVPGVFKSLSIIQLDDLNSSVLQNAMDLKSKFTGEAGIDTNIVIINIEGANPLLKRGEIAQAIRFLKDNGAKTIALDIALDTPSTNINPEWDKQLAEAIKYAGNVITFNAMSIIQDTNGLPIDTLLLLKPIHIFDTCLSDVGIGNMYPPDSKDNPGGVIQYFYPQQPYKGELKRSFPLSIALNYDSSKAKVLEEYTNRLYISFYKKELFRLWDLSLISNPEIGIFFKDFIKNKLFIFGYINPDDEILKTSMFATPIGKLDYVMVYASIVSDILKEKFVPESPPEVDLALSALLCLFNIAFIAYASKKTLLWEKFTGALLVLSEVFIIYFIVIAIYIVFNYAISVIILSIVCFISVPTITIIKNKLIPLYNKYIMYLNLNKYPYPIIKPYMTIFEPDKRSIRHLTVVFQFQRMFCMLSSLSICAAHGVGWLIKTNRENNTKKSNAPENLSDSHPENLVFPSIELSNFKTWNELRDFNLNNKKNDINEEIYSVLSNFRDFEILNTRSINEYEKLFNAHSLRQELYVRAEDETDIHPYLDTFSIDKHEFRKIIILLAPIFRDYNFIYVSKALQGRYLIRSLRKSSSSAEYIKTEKILLPRNVYLMNKKEDIYIPLSPFIQYRMCLHHYKRELFIFASKQYNNHTGKLESNFIGEHFMCSPLDPSIAEIAEEDNL